MATNYKHEGKTIDYANAGSEISSGDVVVIGGNGAAILGIALVDIASGASGAVAIEGVFQVAKKSAAVIAAGESVNWDASTSDFDDNQATPATGDVSGCAVAVESAGSGVTTIQVKLNVGIGTLA